MEGSSGGLPTRQLSLSPYGGVLDQVAIRKSCTLGGLYITESISHKSGGWKSNSQVRAAFQVSLYPHTVEGSRVLCGVSFMTALIPFTRVPPS